MRLIAYIPFLACAVAAMAVDLPTPVLDRRAELTLSPAEEPHLNEKRSMGCFSSKGSLVDLGETDPDLYEGSGVTQGLCWNEVCKPKGYTVMAVKDTHCYCGEKYPPKDTQVDIEKCDFTCQGYPFETCGGIKGGSFYNVFNTGIEIDVPFEDEASTTSKSTPSSTSTPKLETDTSEPKAKANVGGIAAGVVVGIAAVAAIVAGVWIYRRRKRNQEIEEEHRRNAAIGGFMGHKPGSSGAISITDSRLDPGMVQRRLSDGSIADNQDYSRKILRVTNA